MGAAPGLLSDMEAMGYQITSVIGEGKLLLPFRRGDTVDRMSGVFECQLETNPKVTEAKKVALSLRDH